MQYAIAFCTASDHLLLETVAGRDNLASSMGLGLDLNQGI
jgi:hypothetical protein